MQLEAKNMVFSQSAVRAHAKKPTAQIANLVLPDTQADPSQNQKSHFFPTYRQTRRQFFKRFLSLKTI